MKVLALVLLALAAAVQGRSTGEQYLASSRSLAALGEHPWVVHLRIAKPNSPALVSCSGSLIGQSWVLTAFSCVDRASFTWVRYGAVNVINPSLVTESGQAGPRLSPGIPLGLLFINRNVHSINNVSPVALATAVSAPETATFCAFGENDDGTAGDLLSCYEWSFEEKDEVISGQSDNKASEHDLGAPLVVDGVQVGVLIAAADEDSSGTFASPATYLSWIQQETGLDFSS